MHTHTKSHTRSQRARRSYLKNPPGPEVRRRQIISSDQCTFMCKLNLFDHIKIQNCTLNKNKVGYTKFTINKISFNIKNIRLLSSNPPRFGIPFAFNNMQGRPSASREAKNLPDELTRNLTHANAMNVSHNQILGPGGRPCQPLENPATTS